MDIRTKDPATLSVAVIVPPGVVSLDLAIALETFGQWVPRLLSAARLSSSPYRLAVISVGSEPHPLDGSTPTEPFVSALADADIVVVPGVADPMTAPAPALVKAVKNAHARGARIVSICTGAFVLAEAGLLDGRAATTHWMWAQEFRSRFPRVRLKEADLYIDGGDVVTSAGVVAGLDMCLHLVKKDHGQRAANALARFLVAAPHRDGGQAQFISGRDDYLSDDVAKITDWVLEHLYEPLSLARIAETNHLAVRTLSRRFRQATGMSVMEWVARARIDRARDLLESTDLPVSVIATECGFGTAESFRASFVAVVRTTPSQYRNLFG